MMETILDLDMREHGCRLVAAHVDELGDSRAFDEALPLVSEHRRAKARSFRFAKDQRLSLLAGLLLDELLHDWGLSERDMVYAEVEGGAAGAAFLGSQGDVWDAQKDILCDTLGAICSSGLFLWCDRRDALCC